MKNLFSNSKAAMFVVVLLGMIALPGVSQAACRDKVVLIHGNTHSPSNWKKTYDKLRSKGWKKSDIVRPSWGSKSCANCNDHYGKELTIVKNAIKNAINSSCTGKIDIIGHSMGVTLGARAVLVLGKAGKVNTFVGIAGAVRGLNSCGTYPFHVRTTTCGKWGLSKKSKLINAIKGKRVAKKIYSIKSYIDQIVCLGSCIVGGTHTSNMYRQNRSYTYNNLGHNNLQKYTSSRQWSLIK